MLEKTAPCSRGGDSTAFSSWTSPGKMRVATPRLSSAMRIARSIRWRACAGSMQTWTNSETSLKSTCRSTSC